MAFDDPDTAAILAFLERIGIPAAFEPVADDTLLPAMTVRGGTLIVDPERLTWPGDLLHEAGHIAVTAPALRPTLVVVFLVLGVVLVAFVWSFVVVVVV